MKNKCPWMDDWMKDLASLDREEQKQALQQVQKRHQRQFQGTHKKLHALPKARHVR